MPTLTKPAPRPSALEVTLMPWPLWASGFVSSSDAFFGTVASTMTRSAMSDALSPIVDWFVPFTFVDECAFASAPKPPPFASLFEEALTEVYEPTRASWSARTDESSLIVAFVPKVTLAVVWFVATPTKPPAVDLDDEPVTGALSASSVKLPPAMIHPEWPLEPTDAELLLVVEVSARAVPTPTKPPVAFFEFALVLVCEFDLIVTSPPAVTRSASTLAVTFCVTFVVALLSPTPTKPPPEPFELVDDTPSPGGELRSPSGTPPGPSRRCCVALPVPSGAYGEEPVRSMRSSDEPLDAPRSTLTFVK